MKKLELEAYTDYLFASNYSKIKNWKSDYKDKYVYVVYRYNSEKCNYIMDKSIRKIFDDKTLIISEKIKIRIVEDVELYLLDDIEKVILLI